MRGFRWFGFRFGIGFIWKLVLKQLVSHVGSFFSGCNSALGLRQGVIEDSALSASTSLDEAHAASQGRLNGSTGWCAADDDKEASFVVRK